MWQARAKAMVGGASDGANLRLTVDCLTVDLANLETLAEQTAPLWSQLREVRRGRWWSRVAAHCMAVLRQVSVHSGGLADVDR